MDFWSTLGISPRLGVLAGLAGLVAALVLAGGAVWFRSRSDQSGAGLGLNDR